MGHGACGAARPAEAAARCGACRHFGNDPLDLERASPGLASLSSGFGAVLARDGLCREHGRYVAMHAHCARFLARAAAPA